MSKTPFVVVRCPAIECIYNKVVNDKGFCNGAYIDMRKLSKNSEVECLDYVNGDELREEGIIQ